MTIPGWHEEPIAKKHDRDGFDSDDAELNEYLRRYARQYHEKGVAKTFLAIADTEPKTILGFYSLSPASIEYSSAPSVVKKGLARHDVPAFRLGRLAVDKAFHGKGLGGQLLLAAGRRCLLAAEEVGGVVLLIDAKNAKVAQWYASFGAEELVDHPLSLVLPLATIKAALGKSL